MNSIKVVAIACSSAIFGCAGLAREARQGLVERLDSHGVSAPALVVEGGGVLRFMNDDARPHQIYSNDCSELSSTVLNPGDTSSENVGTGPKVCHFEDLLAPQAGSYRGTLQVESNEQERDFLGDG